uniref:Uncharacterized protein n=1 Tax=Anguilla anguilla TaxID=7936 RepID=A0A0E9SC04_ANGAN
MTLNQETKPSVT